MHGTGSLPDDVRIDDDGIETPLRESLYRARSYLPPVEALLWRGDYLSSAKDAPDKAEHEAARKDFLDRLRRP